VECIASLTSSREAGITQTVFAPLAPLRLGVKAVRWDSNKTHLFLQRGGSGAPSRADWPHVALRDRVHPQPQDFRIPQRRSPAPENHVSISRRITIAAALIAVTSGCATWASIHSETYIDAGQSFLLGGNQTSTLRASVRNTGSVPVALLVQTNAKRRPVIILAPDSTIEAELQPRDLAIFENASTRRATIKVDLRGAGASGLGMSYEAARSGVARP
jgi:hypothetical protein